MKKVFLFAGISALLLSSCGNKQTQPKADDGTVMGYARVELKADLSRFSDNDRKMMGYLCDAADIMNDLFWQQAFTGNKDQLLSAIKNDTLRKFAEINYGPWDRLDGNKPFLNGYVQKPLGANFYPGEMTSEEFDALKDPGKTSLYTMIRRDDKGKLRVIWYHDFFKEEITQAAALLDSAAALATDAGFKNYLTKRAEALRTDQYYESDLAWMDAKTSDIDFVIGPIENYEDAMYGYKAAYESFLLIKDPEWSAKLAKYSALLPDLQKELPVDGKYKAEMPGTDSDLNVYDVILYRGDCNAGGKTIAINLPNDERVHIQKGTRKLQLKNAMQAKFDKILMPISEIVMNPEQQKMVDFNSFFENVTFHEVAHGLGVKETVNGKGKVDDAMGAEKTTWEEAKADILGLFMVCRLIDMKEIPLISKEDAITTFIAGLVRSVRFGSASSHGKANMMCYNFMKENGAFSRNKDGQYHIDYEKALKAIDDWAGLIIKTQATGDAEFARTFSAEYAVVPEALSADIANINAHNIPRDIKFDFVW